jgi:hypothetical protein
MDETVTGLRKMKACCPDQKAKAPIYGASLNMR